MKMTQLSAVVLSVAAGAFVAVVAAPFFHTHADPGGRLTPMWAHNYGTLGEMAGDADGIVLATVTDVRPGRTVPTAGGQHQLGFTLVDLDVDEVVAGRVPDQITVEQTGGTYDGMTQFIDDDGGPYLVGSQVLLFLRLQPDTGYYYVSHPKGRFEVLGGELAAVLHDDPVAQALHGRTLTDGIDLIDANR